MNAPTQIVPPYKHTPLFPLGKDTTPYRKLTSEGVRVEKSWAATCWWCRARRCGCWRKRPSWTSTIFCGRGISPR